MTRRIYNAGIVLSVFIISLLACKDRIATDESKEHEEVLPEDIVEMRDDQRDLAGIELGEVVLRSLGNTIRVNGIVSVAPGNYATVCMPLGGFVKQTSLLPGNSVRRGQLLAVMENQDFVDIQQDYLETRNKLIFAEEEYKRHTELYKNEVYSEKNVQQVTVEYRNLKAKVHSLGQKLILIGIDPGQLREENISATVNLVSPINGFLSEVNVNIGKYVTQTDVLFEIINSDKLYLELTLFEKDAAKTEAGQKVRFFITDETEEHTALITQTGRSVSDDKTFTAYASVTSECKHLLPGMYVNAYIDESDKQVMALPSDAVVSFDDKEYIFIFEKEKEEEGKPFTEYRMVEVDAGVSEAGFTEIRLPSGLDMTSVRAVVKGAYNLLSAKKNAGEMAC